MRSGSITKIQIALQTVCSKDACEALTPLHSYTQLLFESALETCEPEPES